MAFIEINSQRIKINEQNFLNLKSIIPKLQKEFPVNQFSLLNLKVNGEVIDINSENPKLIRPIEKDDLIEIDFQSKDNILYDIILDLSSLVGKILKKIKQTSDNLKCDKNEDALVNLSVIIDAIDLFIKGINQTILKSNLQQEEKDFLPIKELQVHLLSIVKAISGAYAKQDYIMLTDLLEYELRDNLTQWKILILPVLKKELQS